MLNDLSQNTQANQWQSSWTQSLKRVTPCHPSVVDPRPRPRPRAVHLFCGLGHTARRHGAKPKEMGSASSIAVVLTISCSYSNG